MSAKSLEELIKQLVLYQGSWAVEIKEAMYVFPPHITREEAVEALTKAYELNKTKHN